MKEYHFSNRFLSYFYNKDCGWFRLFKVGLAWKNVNTIGLNFSQRYGITKYLKIGKWIISFLPKN